MKIMSQEQSTSPAPPPPVPPDDLLDEWKNALWAQGVPTTSIPRELATLAATWAWEQAMATLPERERAAADAELKACRYTLLGQFNGATWSKGNDSGDMTEMVSRLHATRRPKPPTLAEQGISALNAYSDYIPVADERKIRGALLYLREIEHDQHL